MLQALISNPNTDGREATCDSCEGRIGGPRLTCLDCAAKSTEVYDSLDLCCAPKCVSARLSHRKDIEGAHEPNHRLIKVRTARGWQDQNQVLRVELFISARWPPPPS
jgi:hypothetical protein